MAEALAPVVGAAGLAEAPGQEGVDLVAEVVVDSAEEAEARAASGEEVPAVEGLEALAAEEHGADSAAAAVDWVREGVGLEEAVVEGLAAVQAAADSEAVERVHVGEALAARAAAWVEVEVGWVEVAAA